jgi:hypothetical protein
VVTPSLPERLTDEQRSVALKTLLDGFLAGESRPLIRWYYTPMMLPFSRHMDAICTVYDCMDELANFRFAPAELLDLERELLAASDVVFTAATAFTKPKRGATRTSTGCVFYDTPTGARLWRPLWNRPRRAAPPLAKNSPLRLPARSTRAPQATTRPGCWRT